MKHVLRHLAAVTAAAVLTGGVLGGAGKLIVFGGGAPTRAEASPERAAGAITVTAAIVATAVPTTPSSTEPMPSRAEAPTPKPATIALTPFRFGGRGYLGMSVLADEMIFAAPFAGTVEIRLYQFIDGEVRVGSNVPSLPFFPYISVSSSDARMTYRPGALVGATELITKDGARVASGDPLFRTATTGRSSWSTFYDSRAAYHVVVSLQTLGGRDLDASTYFSGP